MSQLSKQLSDFRATHNVVQSGEKTSFLFDKRDILSLDPVQLASLAQTGFQALVSADPELSRFS